MNDGMRIGRMEADLTITSVMIFSIVIVRFASIRPIRILSKLLFFHFQKVI